ncbi:23S rRNA (adenine(2030)-N(6))-methyltransferase RlmJ [Candidatus Saccharibacteria bacterium]|nr:23S rRNA (adenine(2030)-N(6))-methyltransferase RlmJ [Candidatus Saccharibacteria bacterium]
MRIISGIYKNHKLVSPNSDVTHPMGERERLAIFNMIGDCNGKTVLDLFAGTGALGIEALSRGAAKATFVEMNPKALLCLKDNLSDIDGARIIKLDAYKYDETVSYDIIFVDPPYDKFDKEAVNFQRFLSESGVMVLSSPEPIGPNSRKYAGCYITLIRKNK